ncbi:unnamed protein product (macronuclear) [Paramecium tetraurelia]|uniref:Uncharacterized protein n=1 Tax=Paramecium tetraurelia TaxID=5888 RepID=A0BHZ9_PARTE|nr:uncharacterized protein GSPATT00029202001 [Paramecium tetraurelia]CAK58166.1 unnamed protein product [Paramecium tetraurelia]|eukprot:XP_001425564.1 hypothetical protein (macronuclear) [Paramecium tetraurelia strain d4-2]
MQQLSLNNIPQNLFPLPIVKSHYEIQHLQELRNEQENQIWQDHSKLLKEKTPNRRDYSMLQKNKRQSTVTHDVKNSVRKISEYQSHSQDQILNSQHSIHNNTIDCSINYKQLNKHIITEQQFQIKQNQIQQMIREKLYTSYCNSMKKHSKLNGVLLQKISELAPFISQDKNMHQPQIKRMNQFLKFRSQSIPLNPNIESVQNSIQRIQSLPRNQDNTRQRTANKQSTQSQVICQNKDADRIIRKLNRKTQRLLKESYPEIDPTPIVDYQKQILNRIELRNSTKKKLIDSFQEIIDKY